MRGTFCYNFVAVFLIFLSPSISHPPCSLWLLPPTHASLTSIPFRHLSSHVISDLLFYSDDGDLTDVSAEPMDGLTQLLTMKVSNIFWFVILCHVVIVYFKPSLQGRLASFTFCLHEHTKLWFLFLYPFPFTNLPPTPPDLVPNSTISFETIEFPLFLQDLDFQIPLLLADLKPRSCTASAQHMALHLCSFGSPKDPYLGFKYDHIFLLSYSNIIYCL